MGYFFLKDPEIVEAKLEKTKLRTVDKVKPKSSHLLKSDILQAIGRVVGGSISDWIRV